MSKWYVSGHEGQVVTDGRNLFRIVNGQRVWLQEPPPEARQAILENLAALALKEAQ